MKWIVKVSRTYVSATTGKVVAASPAESWGYLCYRLNDLDVNVVPYAEGDGTDGLFVSAPDSYRGVIRDVFVHHLACQYGALAVIS